MLSLSLVGLLSLSSKACIEHPNNSNSICIDIEMSIHNKYLQVYFVIDNKAHISKIPRYLALTVHQYLIICVLTWYYQVDKPTMSPPIISWISFPLQSSMTAPRARLALSSAKCAYELAGTKGLLHRLPPSSTFSWNLTQRLTSRHCRIGVT